MNTSPSPTPELRKTSPFTVEKRQLRSSIRSLEKSGASRIGRNIAGIDVQANDLALRSSQLLLMAVGTNEKLTRAINRKGRDAKRLLRSHAT